MMSFDYITGGGILTVVIFSIATYVRADKQIGRVYQRLDEKTDKLKNDTISKDVFEVIHKTVENRLEKIEKQTECIPKIKAGIDMLLQQSGLRKDD